MQFILHPHRNSLLMSDGRLGLGVLNALAGGTCMRLLINWWQHKPVVSTVWKPAARQQLVRCLVAG